MVNARLAVLGSCAPERRMVMAMLARQGSDAWWGDPAALARELSWPRFLAETDEILKPYLHHACGTEAFRTLVPSEVQHALTDAHRSAAVRNLRWASEVRRIVEAFGSVQVPLILVKGAALQRTVYADPSTRHLRDVDLVVRREDIDRAARLIAALGFRPRLSADRAISTPGAASEEESHFYKMLGDRTLLVEIHTRLEGQADDLCVSTAPLWSHHIEVTGSDGLRFGTLEPHAMLRHVCLHLGERHGFERAMLWLLDVRLLLERHGSSIDWQRLLDECEPRARPIISFTLSLARDWLGAPVPARLASNLSDATGRRAMALAWEQLWDYVPAHHPPGSLLFLLRLADLRRSRKYLRTRLGMWTAPTAGQQVTLTARMAGRLASHWKTYQFAWRAGGFRLSSLRAAYRADRRSGQLRELLIPATEIY
jgi:hypothetical protein